MEDILFKIETDGSGTERTIGELRQEFKDLQKAIGQTKEGTDEYRKAIIRLGEVKGQLKDVKEQMIALDPEKRFAAFAQIGASVASGFSAATAATALYGSENEDLTKVLVKVQAATALASGLQGLVGMQKALVTAGLAMKAFAMSNPFTAIAAAVVALVGVIWSLVKAFDDTAKEVAKLEAANDRLADSYRRIGEQSDLAIRKIKALGGADKEIFEAQQKRRDDELINLQKQRDNLLAIITKNNDVTEEQQKELDELSFQIHQKEQDRDIASLEFKRQTNEKIAQDQEKHFDDLEKLQDKKDADAQKRLDDEWNRYVKRLQDRLIAEQYYQDILNRISQDAKDKKEKDAQSWDDLQAYYLNLSIEKGLELYEKEKQQAEYIKNLKIDLERQSVTAIAGLTNSLFENAIIRAKGNARQEYEIKKKQFQFNKAISATEAAVATVQAIQKNYATGGLAFGSLMNIAQAAIGAVNVSSILAKKYPPFEGGAADVGVSPGGGSAPTIEPPQNQQQQVNSTQTQTNQQGDFTGFNQPIRAYVVETEISKSQKTISGIESRAQF